MVKLRMCPAGTRMPTVSRTEGQHLVPAETHMTRIAYFPYTANCLFDMISQ
jgi:hypothetical protein